MVKLSTIVLFGLVHMTKLIGTSLNCVINLLGDLWYYGHGGFTFNRGEDEEKIIAYRPFKKPKGGLLKLEKKIWNTKLSEVQVVVENAIHVIKVFLILGGVFHHF